MSPKEYLLRLSDIENEINDMCEEIDRLRSMACRITSSFNDDVVQTSHDPSKMASIVGQICEIENNIVDELKRLEIVRNEAYESIKKLDDQRYQRVLYLRYFCKYTWEQIAVTMNYSYRHVVRIHGEALRKMKDVI